MGETQSINESLRTLAGFDEVPDSLGNDIGQIVDLEEYRKNHPELQNAYAIFAAILMRLGVRSLEQNEWPNGRIALEVWHPYLLTNTLPESQGYWIEENRTRINIIGVLDTFIKKLGGQPTKILFFDDVHVGDSHQHDGLQRVEFLGLKITTTINNGFGSHSNVINDSSLYQEVIGESTFKQQALALINALKAQLAAGRVDYKLRGIERERLIIDGVGIYLWEKEREGIQPSCDILDLAYRLYLAQNFDGGLILLDLSYKAQQERVLLLASRLPEELRYQNLDRIITLLK